MLFEEYQETLQLWRLIVPASGWADGVWTYIQDFTGRPEPINPTENFLHDQPFGNTLEVVLSPIEYRSIVLPGDGIVDQYGTQRKVIGPPEVWGWELAHLAIKTERTQWTVIS